MNDYTIADISYNQDGEMEQFLLFWDEGEPDTRRATTENILLFDPEDELPFDGGMHRFLEGKGGLKIHDDPKIVVSRSGSNEYSYILSVDDHVIETTPKHAEDFLEALLDTLTGDNVDRLVTLYEDIIQSQVRRSVVNPIIQTFEEPSRIQIVSNGWLVDSFYLVDWDGKMYASNDDPDEADYKRGANGVVEKDTTHEFVQLRHSIDYSEDLQVSINGENKTLTERETMFLAKITWLLNRKHYHPDSAFWQYADRWADVPETEPNLDRFSL